MKKFLIVATALLAGTAVAQTAPVAQPSPAPTVPSVPPAQQMHNRVMTRAETVQMVREHFGEMDSNKDGIVTTAEIDRTRNERWKDFKSSTLTMPSTMTTFAGFISRWTMPRRCR